MCDFILFWYDIEIAYSPQNSTVTLSLISCQNLPHLTGVNILIAMLRHGYSLSSVRMMKRDRMAENDGEIQEGRERMMKRGRKAEKE